MATQVTQIYEVKLDEKMRMTVRGTKYRHFLVKAFNDGKYLLEPQVLVPPDVISKKTLKMMDKSVENLRKGKVSKKVNFKKYS
jgi:DNA-binding transcriptional regulator/RsmH inhibitor MraZ